MIGTPVNFHWPHCPCQCDKVIIEYSKQCSTSVKILHLSGKLLLSVDSLGCILLKETSDVVNTLQTDTHYLKKLFCVHVFCLLLLLFKPIKNHKTRIKFTKITDKLIKKYTKSAKLQYYLHLQNNQVFKKEKKKTAQMPIS